MGSALYLLGLWFSQLYSLRSDSWFTLSKLSVHFSGDFLCSSWRICICAGRPVYIDISQEADGVRRGLHFYTVSKWSVVLGCAEDCLLVRWRIPLHFCRLIFSTLRPWGENTSKLCVSLSSPPLHTIAVSRNVFKGIERVIFILQHCDEWGGAESRGSGARPVELNDNERHLRHSPVSSPTEELRKE